MKTSVKAFAIAALMAIVAVGCSKIEKILPKKDGKWKGESVEVKEYVSNTLDSTYTEIPNDSDGVWEFLKDGEGNIILPDTTMPFTWTVNDDNDEVTICQSFGSAQICFTQTVLESEKNRQVWFFTSKETGDTNWTEQTTTMVRVDD